jgi:hypothetical protein
VGYRYVVGDDGSAPIAEEAQDTAAAPPPSRPRA